MLRVMVGFTGRDIGRYDGVEVLDLRNDLY
jgi:hypothetical protein